MGTAMQVRPIVSVASPRFRHSAPPAPPAEVETAGSNLFMILDLEDTASGEHSDESTTGERTEALLKAIRAVGEARFDEMTEDEADSALKALRARAARLRKP